jgi:hypothetical protein
LSKNRHESFNLEVKIAASEATPNSFPMVFPVKTPYVVGPDLVKLEGSFISQGIDPSIHAAKIRELELNGTALYGSTPAAGKWIGQMSDYCQRNYTENLLELALQLDEDIAILKDGILEAICFCFPSSFIPGHLLHRNFFQLHEPVADNQTLNKATPNLLKHMIQPGKQFRRYVWTLSSLPGLSQFPSYTRPAVKSIEDLYFRTETQSTVGMGQGVSLFFVKVEMTPLAAIWEDREKRSAIVSSLNSMTDAVLEYKGLREIRTLVNRSC